jgi:hypothetical protein
MNRLRILQILIVAAGVTVFTLRYQSLRDAKSAHDYLTSIHEASTPPGAVVTNSSTNAGLSAVDHNELLRLRGQVGILRRELAQETANAARMEDRR